MPKAVEEKIKKLQKEKRKEEKAFIAINQKNNYYLNFNNCIYIHI